MKVLRAVALIALSFLSVTAIWGAALLMANPLGSPMEIPVSVLKYSPFHSFLIPGILLLVSSGLLGTGVFLLTLFRVCRYGRWIALQGWILFAWITTEVIMLRTIVWLHYLYWALATLLIVCGWVLRNQAQKPVTASVQRAASASLH